MKGDTNSEYMALLGAIGAQIENNKNELAFARYEVERLEKRLAEALKEIEELKNK